HELRKGIESVCPKLNSGFERSINDITLKKLFNPDGTTLLDMFVDESIPPLSRPMGISQKSKPYNIRMGLIRNSNNKRIIGILTCSYWEDHFSGYTIYPLSGSSKVNKIYVDKDEVNYHLNEDIEPNSYESMKRNTFVKFIITQCNRITSEEPFETHFEWIDKIKEFIITFFKDYPHMLPVPIRDRVYPPQRYHLDEKELQKQKINLLRDLMIL
ncbi:MAG: hypothetical protein K1060chlam2_01524, partial [Chlamydiae bacterium]|nr:hypothetical protein [Chlamydiota bacterium]